jgi:hypothetical protein
MTEKKEIIWNIVNSLLAGALVFFGAFTAGKITLESVLASVATFFIVAIAKFASYWTSEKEEYTTKLFKFI